MKAAVLALALLSFTSTLLATTYDVQTVPTADAPGAVAIDAGSGKAFVIGRVADQSGTYTATVLAPSGAVAGTVTLDGTPFYYGPYPVNSVTGQVIVPLFSPNGGSAPVVVDEISTSAPYNVTPIAIPGATSATVAAVAKDGNTYVAVLEADGLHLVQIAPDLTQTDKFLFANGTSTAMLLVNQYLYVIGSASGAGMYIVDTRSFAGTLKYTFVAGTFGNYLYTGTMLATPDNNVYVACNTNALCSGVSVFNGIRLLKSIHLTGANSVAYNPVNNIVYLTASVSGQGQIWQIQGTSLLSPTPITQGVASNPVGIAFSSKDADMYFVEGDSSLRCLDIASNTAIKIGQLPGGSNPFSVTLNPVNGSLHVPNNGGPNFSGQDLVVTPSLR